jgi:predicted nuclease of predicted toxin-antitoxin system
VKRFLFDQNLSPRLVTRLTDLYPNSTHVDTLGLGTSSDRDVWEYARLKDFMIVTKDTDFSELSILLGTPPKVIWIRRGNCSTNDIEKLLRDNYSDINAFSNDVNSGVLTLF